MSATSLLLLFLSAVLVNNFILSRFLGICSFLGVSKKMDVALSLGVATTFVMVLSAVITWAINEFILVPFQLEYMTNISFILVIASLVQLVEMFIKKTSMTLYNALGIYLPLITTNCAILGFATLAVTNAYGFIGSVVFGLGAGVGFTMAICIMAGIREELEYADIPKPFQGIAITLIIAFLMSMAFLGFSGMISI